MFRSATLKLTLWYVLLATLLSLLFSVVLYHFSTNELTEALNHQYSVLTVNDHDSDNSYRRYQDLDSHAQHLLSELVYFNIAVIAGSSLLSYLLARRTLKPIEAAHQAQVRFTAEASHELRTPLAAMRADSEVALMEKGNNTRLRHALQDNVRDIQKLEDLSSHLLDISRYKTTLPNSRQPLDLDNIVSEVLKQLNRAISGKQLEMRLDIQPVQIIGDHRAIQQLITLVLDNAVKYSRQNGVITTSLKLEDSTAVLIIKDEGIGIPQADLSHIFEPFYRSKNVTADKQNIAGHGLGLSLAREIVKTHKGTLQILSKGHKGTEAVIKLPVN